MWHRWLSAVPVLGVSVLITYAPWLMTITTLITALPHYVMNIIYLHTHKVRVSLVNLMGGRFIIKMDSTSFVFWISPIITHILHNHSKNLHSYH
jgi:Ca2+/Na+ antiporter